jgi:hypothetical protein
LQYQLRHPKAGLGEVLGGTCRKKSFYISHLRDAKRNGIVTPLSSPYELEILRRTETTTLGDALTKIPVRG